jgi:hypothetical protein
MFYDQIILRKIKFAIVPQNTEQDGLKLSFGIDQKYFYVKRYNPKNRSMTYVRHKLLKNCGNFEPWNNLIPKHSSIGELLVKDKWEKIKKAT